MSDKIRWILPLAIVIASALVSSGADGSKTTVSKSIQMSSEQLAATMVAYEEHRLWWKERGVELTPKELLKRHWAILVSQVDAKTVVIRFLPASSNIRGGAVSYKVDLTGLNVIERDFER